MAYFDLIKYILYIALTGELGGVYFEYPAQNLPCYKPHNATLPPRRQILCQAHTRFIPDYVS